MNQPVFGGDYEFLSRFENEGGSSSLVGVAYLCIIEHSYTEVISRCQIVELDVRFGTGAQLTAELDGPHAILPLPGGRDFATVTHDG